MAAEKRLLKLILLSSEILAIAALISTGDVLPAVILFSGFGLLLLSLLENKLPRHRFISGGLILFLIPLAVIIGKVGSYRPLEVASQIVLLLHLALFFLPDPIRARRFRLAMTFVITSLAAGLSPEFLTGTFIVLYFISAFIALIFQFAFDFSGNTLRDLAKFGRFKIYLATTVGVLGFLAVTALVFPMLPRLNVSRMLSGSSIGKLGFSGEVDLQGKADPNAESTVALRIEIPTDPEAKKILTRQEFLKARNLDSFDGRSWYPSPSVNFRPYYPTNPDNLAGVVLRREALDVNVLPVLYGSQILELLFQPFNGDALQQGSGNSFRLPGSSKRGITYRITLPKSPNSSPELFELPNKSNRQSEINDADFDDLLAQYANIVFKKNIDASKKIIALENYFKKEGFRYSLEPLTQSTPSGFARFRKFLVEEKKGHCELFATAAALLIRKSGTPARLAAGFRFPTEHGNRFITLRNSDAHVWVEVWDQNQNKWLIYDPTPVEVTSFWKTVYQDAYSIRDDLEAYWYRYVVDSEDIQFVKLARELLVTAFQSKGIWFLLVLMLSFFGMLGLQFRKKRILAHFGIMPRPEIRKLAFRIIEVQKKFPQPDPQLQELLSIYNELRFARPKIATEFSQQISKAEALVNQLKV